MTTIVVASEISLSTNAAAIRQRRFRDKAENKEKIRERRKLQYTKEAEATQRRRVNVKTWGATVIANIRYRAKQKGIECTITADDIIVPDHCPVLGIPLEINTDGKNVRLTPNIPSVDRFDNTKGYTPDNIRVISARANHLKSNATAYEIACILSYMKDNEL